MTEFFVDMVPPTVTHQEKRVGVRNGKPYFYELADLKSARKLLTIHLKIHRPREPYTCGLELTVRWQFPRGRHKPGYRTTRPDTDNIQKLLKDVMTSVGFWKDDALVAVEHVEKVWSDRAGIYIKIKELDHERDNYAPLPR